MTANSKSKERVRGGEVFTPATTVFEMILLPDLRDVISDIDKTILDPAAGQGQFPCTELFLKMFFNLDKLNDENCLRILKSIYGIELRKDNLNECHLHMLETFRKSYEYLTNKPCPIELFIKAGLIIKHNIIQGDALKIMQEWTDKKSVQPTLF